MNTKLIALGAIVVLAISGVAVIVYTSGNNNTDYDIVIACGTKTCYEPFWVAQEKGFFEEEGVKVSMKYVDGGGSATTALLAGEVDMTLVGADPAIRLFESSEGGYAIATIEVAKSNTKSTDFAYRTDAGVDLADASSLLNGDGSVKVHCGLDTTTGYYSGYISYLYEQCYSKNNITEEQYALLKTVKTPEKDGGIVHVSFDNQVAALNCNSVQMLCSGNVVAIASSLAGIAQSGTVEVESVVGGCVIIVSDEAYKEKADKLSKVLIALDRACYLIENDGDHSIAKYCAEYYGAEGWTTENQSQFFSTYYWDICNMSTMVTYLEQKAALLGYENADYSKYVKTDLVVNAHQNITAYGGLYTYDADKGCLVEA